MEEGPPPRWSVSEEVRKVPRKESFALFTSGVPAYRRLFTLYEALRVWMLILPRNPLKGLPGLFIRVSLPSGASIDSDW